MTNEMKTKKVTKRERFNQLLEIPAIKENAELVAFIEHEIELLARKNSSADGEKKPTAKQKENDALKEAIYSQMEDNKLYTITEMQKNFPECAELSNQKVAAMLRQMIEDGQVVKEVDKRKSYFRKA